jgi:tetratricopeptide (TPR) repeat protein
MDESTRENLARGRELYARKKYSEAAGFLEKVADTGANFADVFNMLGVIHHDGGRFADAVSAFEKALGINPAYTEAALNLAVTYNDMGRYQEAKDVYQNALSASAEPGTRLDSFTLGKLANMYADIAEVFLTAGAYSEAVAEYDRALALRPGFLDIRLRLSQVLRDAGDRDRAIKELRTILSSNPDFTPARLELGITLYAAGDKDGAVEALERVQGQNPNDTRAALYLKMIAADSKGGAS